MVAAATGGEVSQRVTLSHTMATKHLSIRIDPEALDRLDRESRHQRMTRSELARQLVEEGLRMEAHPGIVFKPGPTGRRPAVFGGPDVWELVRSYRGLETSGDEAIKELAEAATLTPQQVRAALSYYAEFQDEIDAWIRDAGEYADQAYNAWLREQQALAP